jgi:peptide/nickel transport system substrate-binding protein
MVCAGSQAWAAKSGGTLVVLTTPEPPTLTNAFNSSTTVAELGTKIFDGLLEYDADGKPQPGLAQSWSVTPDGRQITFKLRPGVKWHDGQPFTSGDVQFSLMEVIKPFHPRGQGNFGPLQSVDTPDDLTVVLHLAHPYPAMIEAFPSLDAPILPKHLYAGTDMRNNPYNIKPVGTGPWMFKEWQRGSAIILERNPHYWHEGRPYLDRLIFRFIKDPATRAAALESGEAHVATFGAIAPSEMRRLEKAKIAYIPPGGYQFIAPMVKLTFNNAAAPFNDRRVRQAVAYAIDRKFIVDKIFYGLGTPAVGPIGSGYKAAGWFFDDVQRFDVPDRLKRAEALLDEAGYKKKSDGTRLEIVHDVGPIGDDYRRMGEYLKQALGRVGIKVTLRTEDIAGFIRRTAQTYDYQMASAAWIGMGDPTLGIGPKFVSSNIRQGVPFSNIARYSDPENDAMWEKVAIETDPRKRADLFHNIQRKLVNDSPEVFVFELQQVPIARMEVKDLLHGAFTLQGGMYETWLDR